MFNHLILLLKKHYTKSNKLLLLLVVMAIVLSIFTYSTITKETNVLGPDPSKVIGLILVDLIIFLALGIVLSYKIFKHSANKSTSNTSKLQNRIIVAFSLVAAVPTIIVSVFSAYFFNFGLQIWFDKKISTVLDQSISVAESYLVEHTIRLKESAAASADDLSEMYYDLIHNPTYFAKALNAEAEMRSLDEAIVFQKTTNTILAQTSLSFSLSFTTIPMHLIEKADRGEIVEITSDPTKIRMLIKLREYNDTYLLVGRIIDSKIIDHIDKTNGAASSYYQLKTHISSMQIKFSMIFIFIALLLLLAAISWGAIFAGQIVSPIHKLVIATEKVKDGDLTIQVPEGNLNNDEIKVLSSAFNRMIQQINRQQRDLLIAQRALAWSDVARRVAHEIKNPLTPIQLSAERLFKKFRHEVSDQTAFDRYINTITRHINDIKKIVSEFVNFARLPLPTFTKCELVSLIKDMVDSRKSINDKITYKLSSSEKAINFVGDITQLHQIMLNLLKNAEEATEKIAQQIIDVSITQTTDLVYVIVADNGPGFTPELLNCATEAYITNRAKGTGLGLAIVKKITQDHFGSLEISNAPQGGALIKLTFNLTELKSKLQHRLQNINF
ncbi:sensor histidine kinase NtrY-like [Candidatus Trichorickettsia mobilis]|uniref:sensor histidine kinase NtrY-like n=1 Tax=Candidatus Trichorickettsia mobilis TaxID=1346319 RepID=UPI00292D4CFE|nr:ATP-binding protein [Candidatus Trichorickettsia mobilis]